MAMWHFVEKTLLVTPPFNGVTKHVSSSDSTHVLMALNYLEVGQGHVIVTLALPFPSYLE
jgi:hypothetical protein